MTTRCKDGDLAIIENDVAASSVNIGRIVRVRGPAEINRAGQLTWLIQPLSDEPYVINDLAGNFEGFMVFGDKSVEHQDEWMRPIPKAERELGRFDPAAAGVPRHCADTSPIQSGDLDGLPVILKQSPVAPRIHHLVRKCAGQIQAARLTGFIERVWADLLSNLQTPIRISGTDHWRFVVIFGCIRFAVSRRGGQIDVQEQVWHEGNLRYVTTKQAYAIDLPLRLTGFWLESYLTRWRNEFADVLADGADETGRAFVEKAVIAELQRAVRRSTHWRRLRHQLRDALCLDRELLQFLKINQCIPYTDHRGYNRYVTHGEALRRAFHENPHLAWLVFFAEQGSKGKMPASGDLIAWVKEKLNRAGVTDGAWRYLCRCRREDFLPILERPVQNRWGLMVNWLKVIGVIHRIEPVPVQVLRWLYNTVRLDEGKLRLNGIRLQVGSLRAILDTAEQRLAVNCLEDFMQADLVDVLAWLNAVEPRLDPNQIRRGWAHLARQAAIWKEDVSMSEQDASRWVSLVPMTEIDGHRVTPLTSFYQIWKEGVSLRHCIGDANYAERCMEGTLRLFSISKVNRRLATLSLVRQDDAWIVNDIRGFANQALASQFAAIGEMVASRYNTLEMQVDSISPESTDAQSDMISASAAEECQ